MKKKMWHCKYCGNTQDASEPICRSCGNDLVIYGDIIFEEQGGVTQEQPVSPTYIADPWQNGNYEGAPQYQQGNNGGVPPYQQGNNGGVPPYQQGNNGGVPSYQQGNNGGVPPYQQGNNGGVPPYQQGNNGSVSPYQQYGSDAGNGKSGGKKGIIALIAVLLVAAVSVAAVFLLTGDKKNKDNTTEKYDYPSSSTTTTKPTTTAPTTSAPSPAKEKGKLPDFGTFAAGHTVSSSKNNTIEGKTIRYSRYEVKPEKSIDVAWDYIELLRTYDFEFMSDNAFIDDDYIVIVGQYDGTADVDGITYTLDDGTVYEGEIIITIDNSQDSKDVVTVFYDDDFELCTPSRKTTVTVFDANAAVLPDYAKFSDGRATVYYSEYDEEEDIYRVEYEVNPSDYEGVLDEYVDLLEDTYSYSINNSYDDQSWIGLSYTGTESVSAMTTTFTDGSKYYDDAVTIDVDYYEDCTIVEICYVGDIELAEPLYIYDSTY